MKIYLTHIDVIGGGELIGNGICNSGNRVGSDKMYKGSAEPVLDSLSDLYSDEDRISQ